MENIVRMAIRRIAAKLRVCTTMNATGLEVVQLVMLEILLWYDSNQTPKSSLTKKNRHLQEHS